VSGRAVLEMPKNQRGNWIYGPKRRFLDSDEASRGAIFHVLLFARVLACVSTTSAAVRRCCRDSWRN